MKIDLYTQEGAKNGTLDLPKEMFEVPFNMDLIHQALVRQTANERINIAHTKIRGDVRGGGRKPYKQKGTGNARQGSTRSPQWKGGSVVFGPRNNRNFSKMMPKKQRRQALFSALSEKARDNQIIGLEEYKATKPRTKDFEAMIKKLPIKRNVLIVLPEKNAVIEKSAANLSNVKIITAGYVNIRDLRDYRIVMILKDALTKMQETFLTKKK
ncbi:MAG: 50S ribosomal protein L4 [Candidatus Gracilibacteria bacterium]